MCLKTLTLDLFFLLTLVGFTVAAQGPINQAESLSPIIDNIIEQGFQPGEPGGVALVANGNGILYEKAFGMANLELDVPMKTDMVFRIGSVTKQFTAVAILQLVEQGKISLQDDITKFIPDYPAQGHTISIHHLLNHTSGIMSYTDNPEVFNLETMRKSLDPEGVIDLFKDRPMNFAPGERFSYNNSGYILLGYIIEKVSRETYPDYVRNHLFEPAGMVHSLYGDDKQILKNRAYGYQPFDGAYANADFMDLSLPYAAGSLMSTARDLFKWNEALKNEIFLKQETLELAFQEGLLNDGSPIEYGYGWSLGEFRGSRIIFHGGGINGFVCFALWLPQEDLYVAVLMNATGNSPEELALRIAGQAIGKPFPEQQTSINPEDLQDYSGLYEGPEDVRRAIYVEDGKLFSMRTDGTPFLIFPFEKDKFFYENSLTTIEFLRDRTGKITSAIFRTAIGKPENMVLTDLPLPEKPEEMQLPAEILQRYPGKYELAPGFMLTITLENGKLMTQATGQSKFEIFARTETLFFPKVVAATLEFVLDNSGNANAVILKQAGQELRAPRVE